MGCSSAASSGFPYDCEHAHHWWRALPLVAFLSAQDFLQVVSMFSGFQFDWPPLLLDVYKWMSFTNFNLELVAPECNFHVRAIPAHACGRADHWWYSRSPLLR